MSKKLLGICALTNVPFGNRTRKTDGDQQKRTINADEGEKGSQKPTYPPMVFMSGLPPALLLDPAHPVSTLFPFLLCSVRHG